MDINQILFFILSGLTVLTALLTVFAKNPIHSILFLIATFFGISGHYILLNAQFLAIVNIIVYAGAIMVLFLFVVMLMNLNKNDTHFSNTKIFVISILLASGFLLITIKILYVPELNNSTAMYYEGNIGLIENLGKALYKDYVLPFELSTILFISAMIGAVLLAKKDLKSELKPIELKNEETSKNSKIVKNKNEDIEELIETNDMIKNKQKNGLSENEETGNDEKNDRTEKK